MAKRADATYRGGRSTDWLKIKAERTDDLVVVGYTLPQGSRAGLGALHLAGYDGERLVYAGRVGTGFSGRQRLGARARPRADRRPPPPRAGAGPGGPAARGVGAPLGARGPPKGRERDPPRLD